MGMLGKKGDKTVPATWLILMIGLFMIAYIIFLPESERDKLISDPSSVGNQPYPTGGSGYPSGVGGGSLLLQEIPGIVYPLEGKIVVKPLASVNLFSFSQLDQQGLASSLYIEKRTFSEKEGRVAFVARDPRVVEQAQLLFLVRDSKGELVVEVNGIEIYRGEATIGDLPITIPRGILSQSNIIHFRVSSPGANIFTKNFFDLKDVQVYVTERLENTIEARQIVLNDREVRGMQRMTLHYVLNCFTVQEQGRLSILLNGNVIADGLVVCDAGQISVDINPAYLVPGTNVLEFAIDEGRYVVEQVVLEEEIGSEDRDVYSFVLQVLDIERLVNGGRVILEMRFPNDGVKKVGTIFLNGVPLYINQFEPIYSIDVTPFVTEGQNFIRLAPDVPLDVAQLTVTLY